MKHEHKTVKFEVKEIDEDEGTFEGYAATFSKTPDSYGDIIDKGAFKKTLKERFNRIKILWNHYILEPIGKPLEMKEDDHGLHVIGKLSLGVQRGKEVLALMKDGVITELSIGYDTMKETYEGGIRHLQEIQLWDFSPVTFAANPEAVVISVKKATTYSNFPLADRDREWDASAVEKRVRAWAGGTDEINWNKYRQAFFWYDAENPELFGSYKLGFADIIDSRLTAIPRGIFAVAAVLMGARGGVNIPESDVSGVKAHVEKYYAKMRKEFDDEDIIAPWNKSAGIEELKPLPHEHTCQLRDPGDFEEGSFKRSTEQHEEMEYSVISGKLKGEDSLTDQAYRYDKEVWPEAAAKSHAEEHDGIFEPAEKRSWSELFNSLSTEKQDNKSGRVLSGTNLEKVRVGLEALESGIEVLKALIEAAEAEPEPVKATQLTAEVAEEAAKLESMVSTLKAENEGFDTAEAEKSIEAILEKLKK